MEHVVYDVMTSSWTVNGLVRGQWVFVIHKHETFFVEYNDSTYSTISPGAHRLKGKSITLVFVLGRAWMIYCPFYCDGRDLSDHTSELMTMAPKISVVQANNAARTGIKTFDVRESSVLCQCLKESS